MTDYISREAALRVLCDACGNAACPKGLIPRCSYYEKMQSLPAADVRPVVRGKWISHNKGWWRLRSGNIATDWHSFLLSAETFKEVCDIAGTFSTAEIEWKPDHECSACGARSFEDEYNFCPNCGADMREES